MTGYIVLALVLISFLATIVASIADPKPQRKPREWTIGALLGDRQ